MAMTPPRYPRYHIGQRVRNRDPAIGVPVGHLGTVIEIKGTIIIVRWDTGDTFGSYPCSIEPAP